MRFFSLAPRRCLSIASPQRAFSPGLALLCALAAPVVATAPVAAQDALPSEPVGAPADAIKKVAVLPLRVTNLQGNDVKRLNALVREGIAKRDKLEVQKEETTTELVDSALSLGLDCQINSLDCAVSLGELANVSLVVLGQATGFGENIGLDIEVIDVASKRQLYRGSRLVPADLDAQEIGVRTLFLALFNQKLRGQLKVASTPAGAKVFVNGTERGQTPLESIPGLILGPHRVEIVLDKHDPYMETVELKAGEQGVVDAALIPLTLDRAPRTAVELALPFGVLGGGLLLAAGGATALAFGVEPLLAYNAATDAHTDALTDPVANAQTLREQRDIIAERAEQLNTWGMATLVTGGAVAAVGTAIALGGGIWGGLVVVDEFLVE